VSRILKAGVLALLASALAVPAFCVSQPDDILRSALTLLANAKTIRVHAEVMSDEVVATGQKLQRSSDGTLKIRRPDGLRVEIKADRYRRAIQYDGKTLALYDPDKQLYATIDAPPTIDATAAIVREKFGLDLPLSQLFADNAFANLTSRKYTAIYVGLHRVRGTACHHLAYSTDEVDWQIWIAADGSPLPRKIVVDYKNRPGRPQYIALLSDWNLEPHFDASEFRFAPPPHASKIELLPSEGGSK
jgi:hypothetical protein